MKKYLYIKFILAIILLGLLGFSAISLAGGKLMQQTRRVCLQRKVIPRGYPYCPVSF